MSGRKRSRLSRYPQLVTKRSDIQFPAEGKSQGTDDQGGTYETLFIVRDGLPSSGKYPDRSNTIIERRWESAIVVLIGWEIPTLNSWDDTR